MKLIIFFIIIFQIIVNIKCQYVPMARHLHMATLIEKKLYFLGGLLSLNVDNNYLNDFFFLDLSKPIDTTKQIPFIDLSTKASTLPPHGAAAASSYDKDSIFLFGGFVDESFNNIPSLAYSFNSTQLEWNPVTFSQGQVPGREAAMNAVTDNNNKIYIFGGSFQNATGTYIYSEKMNIYDTINKIWTISESGLPGRDGHTATFLPDTNDIIYIGGFGITDLTTLDAYNTQSNSWRKVTTKNPPESRYGHSAVLTNDGRVVVFRGSRPASIFTPVNNRYVVLDTKTFEWYLGTGDVSPRAPYMHHTATLYDDYMFIAFGVLNSGKLSRSILIYKIGDYANFSLENSYTPYLTNPIDPTDPTVSSTSTSTTSSTPTNSNNISETAIRASIGSLLCITLGFIGFITFKRYKRTRTPKFRHALNT